MRSRWFWPFLAALVAVAFGRAVFFDFAPIDDHALIYQNLAIRDPSWASVANFFTRFDPELYIPLTYLSYFVDHLVFGAEPWAFHLHNLVLHGVNALLVGTLLWKLSGSRLLSAICALLFAVHPLHTEAVVWIAARKDLLSAFFALLAVFCVLHAEEGGRSRWMVAAFAAFLLGLLAKVSIAGLPLILLFLTRSVRKTAPFLIASIVFAIVAIVGKAEVIASVALLQRLFLTLYGMGAVVLRMIVPIDMAVMYALPEPSGASVLVALLPLVLLPLAFFLRRSMPLVAFGVAWMLVTLLPPALNAQSDALAAGATFAADRYGYLPSVGLLIVLAGMCLHAMQRADDRSRSIACWVIAAFAAALASLFIFLARAQVGTWSDQKLLFMHAILVTPSSADAHVSLARILRREGKHEEAFAVLKDALPYGLTKDMLLEAGSIYASAGQVEDAAEQFRRAGDLYPEEPEAYFALGELAMHAGDVQGALALYEQAIEREPKYGKALARKAAILQASGNIVEAESILRDVLAWDPENLDALLNMVDLERVTGRDPSAFTRTIKLLYPDHPDALRVLR